MAKKVDNRTFNVSVVGLSGTEKEKGAEGIGKSCLCNRFMRPLEDDYYKDHISVLSQSDFGGRVVNNDHFLFWGEVSKTDEGVDFTFTLAEQTEFIDDSSFQPFKSGKPEPYIKRCSATRLQSAEKLMYICKNQLGLEHEFEEKMLPEGKLSIDGFLCLFDVSVVHQRSFQHQVDHAMHLLQSLVRTKKPIVFVSTKNDAANEAFIREAEKIASKFKIPVVETSAHQNINVEMAFLALAHNIDRTKGRLKIIPYAEAARARKEVLDVALEAYQLLLRVQVMEYKALWIPVHRKLGQNADYNHFVDLFGTDKAKKLFREHVHQLRDEFLQHKQEQYLDHLRRVLKRILPDLATIADRSWPSTMRWIQRQDHFDQCFVNIPEGGPWQQSDYIESNNERIPFDLLESNEAENCFRDHVNMLRAEHKRSELRKQFKQLLNHNHNVCPGKSLSEVAIFFLGRECFSNLTEDDKQSVYEQHQSELRDRARQDFIELLLENTELFARYDAQAKITTDDLRDINERLRSEPRYQALSRLEDDRKAMLLNHLSFLQCPSRERCPFRDHCMEMLVERLLATKAHRPQSWSNNSHFLLDAGDNRLNLVLLGMDGLAYQLAHEIRLHCVDDDQYLLDNQLYSLDYRPIDGDVSLPQNSFRTKDFLPHGCFCIYNSLSSLEYLRESLEKTLMSDLEREDRLPFQGLPIAIVLAHDPGLSEKGLLALREDGQSLADRLQCPFIDIPSAMMEGTDLKFHKDQIELAMHALIESIKHRSSFVKPWQIAESIEPDIRILMCFMCGDDFNLELPLAPLLNHQCCYVTSDKYPTITLETYLDESKRKVEVTILSYHGASLVQDELYHGYILVYSTKRKAALTTLKSFSSSLPRVPVKLLAVTESGGANAFFLNEHSQGLLTEGNALADRLGASFMTTCTNFQQQRGSALYKEPCELPAASYTPFFKDAWDRKSDTESAFHFSGEDMAQTLERMECDKLLERFIKRPPATLPKPPRRFDSFTASKGSTSNSQSTEDSEPVSNAPHLDDGSESEDGDRASSASPCDLSPYHTAADEVYSEIAPRDTEQLIKPSQVKSRRSMYANTERYRKSFPSASSSFASSSFREDSTDTDSSLRSPKMLHVDHFDALEPHHQFRKSISTGMRLALKEPEEGWPFNSTVERIGRKLTKSSTLPSTATPPSGPDKDTGWLEDSTYDATVPLLSQMENPAYDSTSKSTLPPPVLPKPQPIKVKPPKVSQPLDPAKYQDVARVLNRNISSANNAQFPLVKAPLATPEAIEIGDYAQVRDAVSPLENDYALVHDALPAGKMSRVRSTVRKKQDKGDAGAGSDSDSEFSSLERERERKKEDIYSRVHRRPTPHKKKHKPRYSDSSLPPPPLPPFSEERHLLVAQDQFEKVRSNSPSDCSEGTGDEQQSSKKPKRRSFRTKKKKQLDSETGQVASPPWSDSDLGLPSSSRGIQEDDASFDGSREYGSPGRYGDDTEELVEPDGNYWLKKLKLKSEKDPDKMKRKEEKKAKEDERRKVKEEEKRQKEQQKLQRKMKKKDGKGTPSQSSLGALEDMVQSDDNLLPLFVVKCVTFIEEEGLSVEGIYRVPGNKAHVDLLVERFKEDPNVDIHSLDIPVNAVATALKGFFSELAEPLVPSRLHDELIEAASIRDKSSRILAIRDVASKLPKVNWHVLNYLVDHINVVTEHSTENSMDSKNLAICWWPTLLRPEFTSFEKMTMVSKYLEEIVQCIIDQAGFFFRGESEV